MSGPDPSEEHLLEATAEAARAALYDRCDDGVKLVGATSLGDADALSTLPDPAVCVSAAAEGTPGGLSLCTSTAGARALAIRSLDPLPPEAGEEPLEDGDLDAAREWGAELLSAVASAAAEALGSPFAVGTASARILSGSEAATTLGGTGGGVCLSLTVHDEPCLFVLTLAGDADASTAAGAAPADPAAPTEPTLAEVPSAPVHAAEPLDPLVVGAGLGADVDLSVPLTATRLRVWAQLGEVRLPLRRANALPVGEVIELDCDADAPVDLYVNGLRFGTGQLVVTGDGEWALRVDEIDAAISPVS